ncbi:rhodanese-like domain-containing protein [Mastigocoleus sp. MO_188.B34]|uniref:rhodanese-like domain-containing protein n=1 Tax=Mastigocoleus sp. MO_188.B34 TaxID=3036635 RepID=UPI002625CC44|nr:rhodanese-like domain-containing protein [Mastigocoleus sp. MO_188.B34]MDJ0692902.1 rhodanese-like domain-containing protein [Mastigocoleus sp. MO_188.B34]
MASTSSVKPFVIDISPSEFVKLPEHPLLIDVRSKIEYDMFHLVGAVNLSLPRLIMGMIPVLRSWVYPQWFRNLSKNEPVLVICLTSHRSPIAAKYLVKAGFIQVFNITGGMMEWRRLGLPYS